MYNAAPTGPGIRRQVMKRLISGSSQRGTGGGIQGSRVAPRPPEGGEGVGELGSEGIRELEKTRKYESNVKKRVSGCGGGIKENFPPMAGDGRGVPARTRCETEGKDVTSECSKVPY